MSAVDPAEHQAVLQFLYQIPIGVAQLLPDGELGMSNPTAAQIALQVSPTSLNLYTMLGRYAPEIELLVRNFSANRGTILEDYRVDFGKRSATAAHALVVSFTLIKLARDRVMVVMNDVSRSEAALQRAKSAEHRLRAVADGVRDYAVFSLDEHGSITEWNRSAERLFAFVTDEARDRPLSWLSKDGRIDLPACLLQARRVGWSLLEGWWIRKEEGSFWGTANLTAIHDDRGGISGYTCVVRDQSEVLDGHRGQSRKEDLDPATGTLLKDAFGRVQDRLFEAWRESHRPFSLLLVDVDQHLALESELGEEAAVDALRVVVGTIRDHTRVSDTVVRYEPHRFLILMRDTDLIAARGAGERIRAAQELRVLDLEEALTKVTVSVGATVLHLSDESLGTAIERCERALGHAHARGHNQVVLEHPQRKHGPANSRAVGEDSGGGPGAAEGVPGSG